MTFWRPEEIECLYHRDRIDYAGFCLIHRKGHILLVNTHLNISTLLDAIQGRSQNG